MTYNVRVFRRDSDPMCAYTGGPLLDRDVEAQNPEQIENFIRLPYKYEVIITKQTVICLDELLKECDELKESGL